MTAPNCRLCKHRRDLPGDAHSACHHPQSGIDNAMGELLALLGRSVVINLEAAAILNVTAHPHGVRNGWFNWPWNYDPVWLQSCDGFEQKQTITEDLC